MLQIKIMKKLFRILTLVQVIYQGVQMYKEHKYRNNKNKKYQTSKS